MFVVSAIAYLDRVNISIAGPTIAKEFRLDNVQLGWIFSAFVLGYALFQAPGGRISDRFGPRSTLMIGVIWWGVFTRDWGRQVCGYYSHTSINLF